MSSSQSAVAYPAQSTAQGPYMVAPPPAGYPTKDGTPPYPPAPVETKSKGDDGDNGFWKGCCAALCCCCVLEACC